MLNRDKINVSLLCTISHTRLEIIDGSMNLVVWLRLHIWLESTLVVEMLRHLVQLRLLVQICLRTRFLECLWNRVLM